MDTRKYLDYDGLARVLAKLKEKYISIQTVSFRGVVSTISSLPNLAEQNSGYMYTVTTGGITTSDFVEGAGKTLQDGENVVAVNVAPQGQPVVMKWDILGGVFKIDDRIQFGEHLPANPNFGDPFLYLGPTVTEYRPVGNPPLDANPKALKWYEYDEQSETYVRSNDIEVNPNKTYYVFVEVLKNCVIYVYSDDGQGGVWAPQPYGDTVGSIDIEDIEALFDTNINQ